MPFPKALRAADGILAITWESGAAQQLDISRLRQQCPCADCESLRRKGLKPAPSEAAAAIAELRPVGVYAVQIAFSDGHERGIFPWRYLKTLTLECGD